MGREFNPTVVLRCLGGTVCHLDAGNSDVTLAFACLGASNMVKSALIVILIYTPDTSANA